MARNGTKGGGRVAAERGRKQVRSAKTGSWSNRNVSTGRFAAAKKSGGSLKGLRRER